VDRIPVTSRLALIALCACLAPAWAGAQTRIMALGDSITQGGQGFASYRYALWTALVQAGYAVDLVGSRDFLNGGPTPDPELYPSYFTGFDRDHEGYWGWRTDEIASIAEAAAVAAQPELVLIHLGTNDIGQQGAAGVANADANLRLIIERLRAAVPDVAILLARVIPIGPGSSYFANADQVAPLNAIIDDVAADLDTPASPIIVVDQHAGFQLPTMMRPDGLHPDAEGEAQMASVWLSALTALLPPPNPEGPIFIAYPSFEAPALADGALASGPGTLAGWSFSGTANTYLGILDPPAGSYPEAAGDGTPTGADGSNVAFLFNDGGPAETVTATQTLGVTLAPANNYALRVAIGRFLPDQPYEFSNWGGYRIELLAGETVIASDSGSVDPPVGEFRDAQATVSSATLDPSLLGLPLAIRLSLATTAAPSSTHFDAVRLTRNSAAVPSLSRAAAGGLALALLAVAWLARLPRARPIS
jgi:lysophospholipase L1-like esterase